jgi:ABC-2 type transport system permease protein
MTVASAAVRPARQPRAGHYRMSDLLRSEWTKLRTVRSTMWTLAATVLIGIGVSILATAETRAHWASAGPGAHFGFDPTMTSLTGTFFGQLIIGVLGVLVMSAEYATGTIRATFSAAPRRPLVLAAKTIVFGLLTLVVCEALSFASFLVGQALLTAPAIHATLSSPGALRAVAGTGIFLCLMGLLALGLATIIRHTAGAISAYVTAALVLPLVVNALPESLQNSLHRFLPSTIGVTVLQAQRDAYTFSPWVGLLVLAAYTAAVLVIGGVLLVRRDA